MTTSSSRFGASCTINGRIIKGNIKALENSHLAVNNSTVGGDIDGDRAEEVRLITNQIGGNVQIKDGETPNDGTLVAGGSDVALCGNTLATGNIQVEKMRGSIVIGRTVRIPGSCAGNVLETGNIKVEGNEIVMNLNTTGLDLEGNTLGSMDLAGSRQGGDLQVFKNTGAAPKFVRGNVVWNGVIQCYENQTPFVGGPNTGKADPWMGFPFFGPNQCSGTST